MDQVHSTFTCIIPNLVLKCPLLCWNYYLKDRKKILYFNLSVVILPNILQFN